jgi:hypothetical protein
MTGNRTDYWLGSRFRFTSSANVPPLDAAMVSSGRDRFGLGLLVCEIRDRLEAVIAGTATPEVTRVGGEAFDPVWRGDRCAALSAGILSGQIAEGWSGHGAFSLLLSFWFCFVLQICDWDRLAAGLATLRAYRWEF